MDGLKSAAPQEQSDSATPAESDAAQGKGKKRLQFLSEIAAFAAVIISVFALLTSQEATAGAARAEVAGYANQMIDFDRAADIRNTTQVTVLAEQADAVIDSFGQWRLKLAPSTYRVLATYTTLNTDNRDLALEFGEEALAVARKQRVTIEEIRAHRALADLHAKNGEIDKMRSHVSAALELAEIAKGPGSKVLRDSTSFTGVFAVYSSLLANINGAGPDACIAAREYFAKFKDDVKAQADMESLEVSRRAYRLTSNMNAPDMCGLRPQDDLHLRHFTEVWTNKNPFRPKQ